MDLDLSSSGNYNCSQTAAVNCWNLALFYLVVEKHGERVYDE
jgi:hypothetical protein